MRVLVTGHNGYIGTVLTPMLLEAGYDVVDDAKDWCAEYCQQRYGSQATKQQCPSGSTADDCVEGEDQSSYSSE